MATVEEVEEALAYLARHDLYLWRKNDSDGEGWGFAGVSRRASETWPTLLEAITFTLDNIQAKLAEARDRARREESAKQKEYEAAMKIFRKFS